MFLAVASVTVGMAGAPTYGQNVSDGAAIFGAQCAVCHGEDGQGVADEYAKPLGGDRSERSLTRLIAKTMPADDPTACEGADAEAVASYLYDAFYSPVARARIAPARIELSRLTVRQYQNAVTDLIGSFREPPPAPEGRGLRGAYYDSRRPRGRDPALDRVDPSVAFDFGVTSPDPEKLKPHEFSARWEGSVLAPETGKYEFIVRTDHAARLWVNDGDTALIDAWVKSGDGTEYRGVIRLLAGRAYPIRLEFSKAKQGVDDSKDRKGPPPEVPAFIRLEWLRPGRVAEVIPDRNLIPARGSESFVLEAEFPPDDRSIGYERGTSVSKAWEDATTEAAIEVAGYVAEHLRELSGVKDDAEDREVRLRSFARLFVERAFRRPLSDDVAALYVDRQFAEAPDLEMAIKRVVLLALKSPRFLYLEPDAEHDAYDVASRLSFGLWDSIPDADLLDAAASDRLSTREQVADQARRMLDDPRADAKLSAFFRDWLRLDDPSDLVKDAETFPGFDEAVASDLRTSLELTLDDILRGDDPDFRRLFLGTETYLNGRLAAFYGVDLPKDAPFQKVALDPEERSGILAHPYLLARLAYTGSTSPIHRGVFLTRGVLGRTLNPPPEAFTPLDPGSHPDLNTRERVALQTSPETCMGCHGMINPLGFALERFDAVGRYRAEELGRPVDADGSYLDRAGDRVEFSGARELAAFLASSDEVEGAFVRSLFHHLVKQPMLAFGDETPSDLTRSFGDHDGRLPDLMVSILAETALEGRSPAP